MSELEPLMTADEVAAALGVSRRTVYRIRWLMQRVVRSGERGARWEPSDVRLYKAQRRGVRYQGRQAGARRAG